MTRIWNTPVFISPPCSLWWTASLRTSRTPLAYGSPKRNCSSGREWVMSLRPYPSLALFAIPVIVLEPAKPLAGYLIGTGHFFAGAVTFITAEVLKLTFVERLFHLNRTKLLSIPAFAWGYRYWRHVMDVVESLEMWKISRQLAQMTGQFYQSPAGFTLKRPVASREAMTEPWFVANGSLSLWTGAQAVFSLTAT
jgi:hypothetical protein